jgi:hypothetical protein
MHANKPLSEVPGDYLCWALRECKLSSGLRAEIGDELRRRGIVPPDPASSHKPPVCPVCGADSGYSCMWQQDKLNRPQIKATCGRCGRFLKFAPCVEPFTTMADAAREGSHHAAHP